MLMLLLLWLNCIVRRHVLQDEAIESYSVPLDVKVEVIAGLALCVLGCIAIFTSDLMIISGLYYYDKK